MLKKGANLEYTFVRSIVSKIWKMVGVLLSSSINEVESYIPAVAVLQRVQRKRPLVPYTQIQILTAENTINFVFCRLFRNWDNFVER